MTRAWLLLLLLICMAVAGAGEGVGRGEAERGGEGGGRGETVRGGGGGGRRRDVRSKDNNTKRRRLIGNEEEDLPFINFGNSVVIGGSPSRPETPAPPPTHPEPHTRINSKFTSSEKPSSPPQPQPLPLPPLPKGPPKTKTKTPIIKTTSMFSSSVPQQNDMADILTNLQILNILTTKDSLATHPSKDAPAGVRDGGTTISTPSGQLAGVYKVAARNPLVAANQQQFIQRLYYNHLSNNAAGPSLTSRFELTPLRTPPLNNETNFSEEESSHHPHLIDLPYSTPSLPVQQQDSTYTFTISTHFVANPPAPKPTPKPVHSAGPSLSPTPSASSPTYSTSTATASTPAMPETVQFLLGSFPLHIHPLPSQSHSFHDPYSSLSLEHLHPVYPQPPVPSTISPTPSLVPHHPTIPTVTFDHSSTGEADSPVSSSGGHQEGSVPPLNPPPGVDLSNILFQLTEGDMTTQAPSTTPTPSLPNLDQLTALNQYLEWLKELQEEQMHLLQQQEQQQQQQQEQQQQQQQLEQQQQQQQQQQLEQQQQQQQQQLELDLGQIINDEMILASLLYAHHLQEAQQKPSLPQGSIETPYVPALHGPFLDVAPPSPPSFPFPPAPIDPQPPAPILPDPVDSLPQADAAAGGGGGGLAACVQNNGCALLTAFAVSLGFTAAFAAPVLLPVIGAAGLGRRRRAVGNEGSSKMLDYLKQHQGALLEANMVQVEAVLRRPLNPTFKRTLKGGDSHRLLPLLRRALASHAPHSSSGLLRHICEATAASGVPLTTPTVVTAQHCLLLAAAHRL